MRHGERERVLEIYFNQPVAYLVKTALNKGVCWLYLKSGFHLKSEWKKNHEVATHT